MVHISGTDVYKSNDTSFFTKVIAYKLNNGSNQQIPPKFSTSSSDSVSKIIFLGQHFKADIVVLFGRRPVCICLFCLQSIKS